MYCLVFFVVAILTNIFQVVQVQCDVWIADMPEHMIHLNGNKATGIAYCQATLVMERNGKDIATVNSVRYSDQYEKRNGKWYIAVRRTTFILSDSHELTK